MGMLNIKSRVRIIYRCDTVHRDFTLLIILCKYLVI